MSHVSDRYGNTSGGGGGGGWATGYFEQPGRRSPPLQQQAPARDTFTTTKFLHTVEPKISSMV